MVLAPKNLRRTILVTIALIALGPGADAAGVSPSALKAAPPSGQGTTNTQPKPTVTQKAVQNTTLASSCTRPKQAPTGAGAGTGPGTITGGKPGTVRGAVRELMDCGGAARYTPFAQRWLPTVQCTLDGCGVPDPGDDAAWNSQLFVHGLWPEFKVLPVSTEPLGPLPPEVAAIWKDIRTPTSRGGDTMPEHEWKAHGVQSGLTPVEYKAEIVRLHALHPTPAFAAFLKENPMLPWSDIKEFLLAEDERRPPQTNQDPSRAQKQLEGKFNALKNRLDQQLPPNDPTEPRTDDEVKAMLRQAGKKDQMVPGKLVTLAQLHEAFAAVQVDGAPLPCLICKGARSMTVNALQVFAEARYCHAVGPDHKATTPHVLFHPDYKAIDPSTKGTGNQKKSVLDPNTFRCMCPLEDLCADHYILIPHALDKAQVAAWAPKGRQTKKSDNDGDAAENPPAKPKVLPAGAPGY